MGLLINELVKSTTKKTEQPKRDRHGWYYYDKQPAGTRVATLADIAIGLFKDNTSYLLLGNHSNKYECHRVKGQLHARLLPFLEAGRVYLFTNIN